MKKTFLIACSALPMLFCAVAGINNEYDPGNLKAEAQNTVEQQATHLSIWNGLGTKYYTYHFYNLKLKDGYSNEDFDAILDKQNNKDVTKYNINASETEKWWNYHNDNEYLVCLGTGNDNHMVLPLWVQEFDLQVLNSSNWIKLGHINHKNGIAKDIQAHINENDTANLTTLNENYLYNFPANKITIKGILGRDNSIVDLNETLVSQYDKVGIPSLKLHDMNYCYATNKIMYFSDKEARHEYKNNSFFHTEDVLVYTPILDYKESGMIYIKYPDGLTDIKYYNYSDIPENNYMIWETRPLALFTKNINFAGNLGGLVQVPLMAGANNVILSGKNTENKVIEYKITNVFPSNYYYINENQVEKLGDYEKFFAADLVFKIFESMENVKADGDIKANSLCGISKDDALKYLKEYEKLGNNSKSYFNKTKIETINHENLEAKRDYYFSEVMSMLTRIASGSTTNTANVLAHDNTIIISVSILTISALAFSAIILFKRKRFN